MLSDNSRRRRYDVIRVQKMSNPIAYTFFDESFFANMRTRATYSDQTKDGKSLKYDNATTCHPCRITEEIKGIIENDDSEKLQEFLRVNNPDDSMLQTMLYKSCKSGMFNNVKYLIESKGLNPYLNVQDGLLFTGPIFKAAAEGGNLQLVKYLLEICQCDIESKGLTIGTQDTALSRAAKAGREAIVKYLVSKGANLNPKVAVCLICLDCITR